jgi:dihydrofolate reductase
LQIVNAFGGVAMPDTTCHMSISLDGFVAGPDQSREHPLGKRGSELHRWHLGDERANEADETAGGWLMRPRGAYVMGRNMFGPIRGEWEEDWRGWWGPEPPYHAPVFVLTHHAREPIEMVVLLYTDALVERRHRSLDHGLAAPRSTAADLGDRRAEELCHEPLVRFAAAPEDDVCLLGSHADAQPGIPTVAARIRGGRTGRLREQRTSSPRRALRCRLARETLPPARASVTSGSRSAFSRLSGGLGFAADRGDRARS